MNKICYLKPITICIMGIGLTTVSCASKTALNVDESSRKTASEEMVAEDQIVYSSQALNSNSEQIDPKYCLDTIAKQFDREDGVLSALRAQAKQFVLEKNENKAREITLEANRLSKKKTRRAIWKNDLIAGKGKCYSTAVVNTLTTED
jgi:hypothetical protein